MVQQPQRSAPSAAPSATAADSGNRQRPRTRSRRCLLRSAIAKPRNRHPWMRCAMRLRHGPHSQRHKEQLQARAADESLRKDAERSAAKATVPAPGCPPGCDARRSPALSRRSRREPWVRRDAQKKKDERSVVRSPDGASEWRIDGPAVERSVDSGRTWRAQATGTTVELLAGASPALRHLLDRRPQRDRPAHDRWRVLAPGSVSGRRRRPGRGQRAQRRRGDGHDRERTRVSHRRWRQELDAARKSRGSVLRKRRSKPPFQGADRCVHESPPPP